MGDDKVSVKEALEKLYGLSWMVESPAMEYLLILKTKNKLSGGMKKQVNWLKLLGTHISMKLKPENTLVYYYRLKVCINTRLLKKTVNS